MGSAACRKNTMIRDEPITGNIVTERSPKTIEIRHLQKLARIAISDLEDFFRHYRDTGDLYQSRRILLCLCQGAARNFVYRDLGVKNFDVWAFFRENPERPFPYRRRGKQDFGHSRFGRHPDDTHYEGRRVDVLGRSIVCGDGRRPRDCVREWLTRGTTKSSRELAKSPVAVIHPKASIGRIIWDPGPSC